MIQQRLKVDGHIIDSGIFSDILNTILAKGGDYRIVEFTVGKTPQEISHLEIELITIDNIIMDTIIFALKIFGVYALEVPSAILKEAIKNTYAPEDFYSSSNHRTEIFYQNTWYKVRNQRMDALVVFDKINNEFFCKKLRDVLKGDLIVCGNDSVRVFPTQSQQRESEDRTSMFGFMTNAVSSERSVDSIIEKISLEMKAIRDSGRKIVVVCGPVVVHTGGADALASLVRQGYVHGFLGGNAIAVHDLELRFFGTSLGIDIKTGLAVEHGNSHHMRAINRIYKYGSIKKAVEQQVVQEGLMYEIISSNIPYCLAGSIRDDGPLPETINDMIEAQKHYNHIIEDASLILMLSTMLHSIGVGNMTPSWVKTICVDIHPAVVTKLSDRGSSQAIGIVSDVGLFLRSLEKKLLEMR